MGKIYKKLSLTLAILIALNPISILAQEHNAVTPGQKVEELTNIEEQVVDPEEKPELSKEEKELQKEMEEDARLFREVEKVQNQSIKSLTNSYLIGDYETGEIFESNNIDKRVAIASTTKVLTVFVVLDEISKGNISLDDKITIDSETAKIKGSTYDLKEGEVVTVKELIDAAMIVSANDAVHALSKHVSGSEKAFTEKMGEKLRSLGITNYQIINSSGLPDYTLNAQNELTTRDLFTLSRAFIKAYPEILKTTSTPRIRNLEREFYTRNTDPMLGVIPEVDGLKTGYTGLAGRCLISTGIKYETEENLKPFRLIGITMGSPSNGARYVAAKKLMENGFQNYNTIKIADNVSPVQVIDQDRFYPKEVYVFNKDEYYKVVKNKEAIWSEMEINEVQSGMKKGDVIGHIKYYEGENLIYENDLIIKEDIREKSPFGLLVTIFNRMYDDVNMLFNA